MWDLDVSISFSNGPFFTFYDCPLASLVSGIEWLSQIGSFFTLTLFDSFILISLLMISSKSQLSKNTWFKL